MNTSLSKAKVVETKFVWAPTIQLAMDKAASLKIQGWNVEGNPAPMVFRGQYGTGVAISRVNDV